MNYHFDANKTKNYCVNWIRNWFDANGKDCNAIIGISGGKDSSIVAALCTEALGANRVIGVLMPNHKQDDIDSAKLLCKHLGIRNYTINIGTAVDAITKEIKDADINFSEQATINLPPRIRMSTLYAVSQSYNGRVANTCNMSEDYIGYSTKYGDSAGDFAPIAELTVTEVKAIGYALGLPKELIEKVPSDGLCGKTDEDNLGFTYADLDNYIRSGIFIGSVSQKENIDNRHKNNLFKLQPMSKFIPF